METTQKLLRFLDESPTCYHAAANVCAALKAAGAVELRKIRAVAAGAGNTICCGTGRFGPHGLPAAGGEAAGLSVGGGP